jgi:hypothetical protein
MPVVRENIDRISEEIIQAIWFHLFLKMDELKTTDGKKVRILDRGKWNKDAGPDFRQATIRIGSEILTGDVEIHWRTSDWEHHRHSDNPSYRQVILHVVFKDDRKQKHLPTLVIEHYLTDSLMQIAEKVNSLQEDRKNIFCHDTVIHEEFLRNWILENGRLRFEVKVSKVEERYHRVKDLNEVLYQSIMDALGFSKNREPFRKLSGLISYQNLMQAVVPDEEATALMRLQAILLGAGGLLTEVKSLNVVPFVQRLENLWMEFQSAHKIKAMEKKEWRLFRMRPDNFPMIRIAGFAKFLCQNRNRSLMDIFIRIFESSTTEIVKHGLSILTVSSFGHWSEHYFLEGGDKRKQGDLIGRQRAFEIWVNAVLPVIALQAKLTKNEDLLRKVNQVYASSKSLERNSLITYMKKQFRFTERQHSAQFAQGLIHLHKRCTAYACADCPVFTRIWSEEKQDIMRLEREERYEKRH